MTDALPAWSARVIDRLALLIGPLAIVLMVIWMARWTGGVRGHAGAQAIEVMFRSGCWSGAWMLAAFGLGLPLRRLLLPEAGHGGALQLACGMCALLWLDAVLGRTGVLQAGGSLGAWGLLLLGGIMAVWQAARRLAKLGRLSIEAPPFLIWTAAPAIAVLLLAATSAPGILWGSEFGGYDALSYHLQLPREWMSLGRIEPLEHNVYSFLPSFVEGAFYHLDVLIDDAIEASFACQMLHAWMTLAAAWLVGTVASRRGGSLAGCVAPVILLGTPWTIIAGSLAYNDMAVVMLLAAGLLALEQERMPAWRLAAAIGFFTGAACGAKLTAAGFAALPLVALLLWNLPVRQWLTAIASCTLAATMTLAPWLVGNAVASGNPVFPFATGLFGPAHWSPEQAAIWRGGHSFAGDAGESVQAAWNELMRYGLGPNPDQSPATPGAEAGASDSAPAQHAGRHGSWQPQWSLLPWVAMAGLAAGLLRLQRRRHAMQLGVLLVIQVLFWMLFTHIKSRFMVPAAVPMSLLVALPLSAMMRHGAADGDVKSRRDGDRRARSGATVVLIAAALIAWSSLPVLILSREAGGAPAQGVGFTSLFTGDDLKPEDRRMLGMGLPRVYVNHSLPRDSNVLLVGDATPFYYTRPVTYQTTWDRGPMSRAMHAAPTDESQWFAQLRRDGFTHIVINPTMLEVWSRAGWNDPMLIAERVVAAADRHARLVRTFDNGQRLYAIR